MANGMVLMREVTPGSRLWSCKVVVAEKHNIRTQRDSDSVYRPIVLEDEEGTRVQGMVYSDAIGVVDKCLELRKTYIISGAHVGHVKGNMEVPTPAYRFLWTLNKQTVFQDVGVGEAIELDESHGVTRFTDLSNFMGNGKHTTTVGVVLQKLPREFIPVKLKNEKVAEYLIVDRDEWPIAITLWGEYAATNGPQLDAALAGGTRPVLCAKRISVKNFKGLSISTRYDTYLEVNSGCPESKELAEWACNEKELLNSIAERYVVEGGSVGRSPPSNRIIGSVPKAKELLLDTGNNKETIWVSGFIRFVEDDLNYYIGCGACAKKIHAPEGLLFKCLSCGKENSTATRRYKLKGSLCDVSGECDVPILLFHRHIAGLMRMTEIPMLADDISVKELSKKLENYCVTVELCKQAPFGQGMMSPEFTIGTICPSDSAPVIGKAKKRLEFEEGAVSSASGEVGGRPSLRSGKKHKS